MHLRRSKRSTPRRSRTSVSGSDTTRALAHTTCTRSTARCPAQMLWRLSTRTWPPDIVLVSDQCRHVPFFFPLQASDANNRADPQGGRNREDSRYPTPIPQAASDEEPLFPSPTSRAKGLDQEDLLRHPPVNFLLSVMSWCSWVLDYQAGRTEVCHVAIMQNSWAGME